MGVIHFVPVGDTKLALHDFGGSGPALLILHCNGISARAYLPLVRHCYRYVAACLLRNLLRSSSALRARLTLRGQDAGAFTRGKSTQRVAVAT